MLNYAFLLDIDQARDEKGISIRLWGEIHV